MAPLDRLYTSYYWSAVGSDFLYTSLFTNMVAHKKKIQTYKPFSSYLTPNFNVTLKCGLEVTQGH